MDSVATNRATSIALKNAYQQALSNKTSLGNGITVYTIAAGAIRRPCIIIGEWRPISGDVLSEGGQQGHITLELVAWLDNKGDSIQALQKMVRHLPIVLKSQQALVSSQIVIGETSVGRWDDSSDSYKSTAEERSVITVTHTIWAKSSQQ